MMLLIVCCCCWRAFCSSMVEGLHIIFAASLRIVDCMIEGCILASDCQEAL